MLNWKGRVGIAGISAMARVLSSRVLPLNGAVPRGVSWLYDMQRFAETRDLKVLFDVGANFGQTVDAMLQFFPRSSIFAFEPVASSYRELVSRHRENANVTLVNKALGASEGVGTMALHQDPELNTLVADHPRMSDLTGEVETVGIEQLDSFCTANHIESIDVLKLDVQGWELEVLRGAAQMIEKRRIRFVFSEVGFRRSDTDVQHFPVLNDYLEQNGFWLCGFYDEYRWGEKRKYLGFASALYINPDFAENSASR